MHVNLKMVFGSVVIFAISACKHRHPHYAEDNVVKSKPKQYLTISNKPSDKSITIGINSQFATAISSLIWNGKQLVNTHDHGRLIQSDVVFADAYYRKLGESYNYGAECYNPTEGGSYYDDPHGDNGEESQSSFDGKYSSSSIVELKKTGENSFTSLCNMAFYCHPGETSPACSTGAKNTATLSGTYLEKTVTISPQKLSHVFNYNNIIELRINYQVNSAEHHLNITCFEPIAAYFNGGKGYFTTAGYYSLSKQIYREYPASSFTGKKANNIWHVGDPQIISSADGKYAVGIYSPCVSEKSAEEDVAFYSYGGDMQSKGDQYFRFGFYQRLTNLKNYKHEPFLWRNFKFTAYLIVGTRNDVIATTLSLSRAIPANPTQ